MFCPKCGKKIIVENAKFCFQCGFELADLIEYEEDYEISDEPLTELEADIVEVQEIAEVEKEEKAAEMLPSVLAEKSKDYDNEVISLISYEGDDVVYETFLFDAERIKHYETYIDGTEYVLPLERYEVRFEKDCIVYANIISYMKGVKATALSEFQEYYKANVRNMEEWGSKACEKVEELMKWMQKKSENLLIASKIYSYNANTLGRKIDMSCFENRVISVLERYMEVCENEEQVQMMRKLTKNHSSGGFVGGGFGFSGAMGGIMAAGVANAGVGLARGIKNGITAVGDAMRASANKRAVFQNPENYAVLQDMLNYVADCLQMMCKQIIDRETGHIHSMYNDEEKAQMLITHAEEYAQSEDEFWEDIIQAIEICPYCRDAYEVIYCKYYENLSLISQLKEIYKLFLLDDLDEDIDDLYEDEIQEILQMPEKTSEETEQKLLSLQEKVIAFQMNKEEELTRLKVLLEDLLKKEEEKRSYFALLESYIPEAEKIEEMMQKRDFKSLFEMIEKGSFIAEERYISYYTQKIGEEENVQLYNSIASNAGKHRAYLCIAGVCSYYGWGTEKDIEIARQCILKSAEAGCSYAKAFICKIYLNGKEQLVDEARAHEYLEKLKVLASPTLLLYYGNALSSKKRAASSKCNESDYENTVMYLEYAEKCYILGAKKV